MLDFFRWIGDMVRAVHLAARNRPQITCDAVSVYPARCSPDQLPDFLQGDSGNEITRGIEIQVNVQILLANNGPVDTSIKNIYIDIRHSRGKRGRLHCSPYMREASRFGDKIQNIEIGPRKTWGPNTLRFSGTVWGIDELTKDMKAKLVIEPVAQGPVSKKISLPFEWLEIPRNRDFKLRDTFHRLVNSVTHE